MKPKKRLNDQDKKIKDFLKKGGREGSKKDFLALLKRASQPSKS
jgi:hypothetical protein